MKTRTLLALTTASLIATSQAATFYPIASVDSNTSATDLWPASNLIQGPGVGFDEAEPHDKLLTDAAGNWVTDAPGGFPSDYIAAAGAPIVTLDLGQNQILGEISVWGYSFDGVNGNTNGASAFSLRFATEADGPSGFGTSILANPMFDNVLLESTPRQSFSFDPVTARYVEMTITDNHFFPPGDGSANPLGIAGGDRVGLGEIAFEVIPEPSVAAFALSALGILTILRRRSGR